MDEFQYDAVVNRCENASDAELDVCLSIEMEP